MSNVKTTGAELKAFYQDSKFWPAGSVTEVWHEEVSLIINGKTDHSPDINAIDDAAAVEILNGGVISNDDSVDEDFDSYFMKWKAEQTHTNVVCNIPKEKLEAFQALVAEFGGTIQG